MRHCQGSLRELASDRDLLKNLLVVSVTWALTSFTFYLIIFKLKSLPGNIYVNSAFTSIASALGHFAALGLYKVMHTRKAMIFFFVLQVIGSVPLCLQQYSQNAIYTELILPCSLLVCMFGCAGQFCNLYVSHLDLFPLVFATTTMGVCNIVARSVTIFSPLFAEIPYPVPMVTFAVMSLVAAILATQVRDKVKTFY